MDHRPLVAIINSKSLDQISSPKLSLIRLKEKLPPYCLTAVWRPGTQHKVVDCFSLHIVEDAGSDDDCVEIDACLLATLASVNADDDSGETIMEDTHIVQVRDAGQKDDTDRKLFRVHFYQISSAPGRFSTDSSPLLADQRRSCRSMISFCSASGW